MPSVLFPLTFSLFVYGWLRLAEPCPTPSGSPSGVGWVVCGPTDLGGWFTQWPAWLWRLLAANRWWLLLAVVAAVLAVVAVRAVGRWWWRRAVLAGSWVRITPPRRLSVTDSGRVWRLMSVLAARAGWGWWPWSRPPLTFEIHARDGRLMVGMWRPARVSLAALTARIELAWPGASAVEKPAPAAGGQWQWSGMWLAAAEPETGFLVDDTLLAGRAGRVEQDDPLRSVLATLAVSDGPAVLQVLVRTVPATRLARLRRATCRPARRRRNPVQVAADMPVAVLRGAMRVVLDLLTAGPTVRSRSYRGYDGGRTAPPGLLEQAAMRDAATKLRSGPFLLAAIRVAAGAADKTVAASVARDAASAYVLASTALRPVRLPRAAQAVELRSARRAEWVLYTVAELGVLAHVPTDPAAYRIDTTARHRLHPAGLPQLAPEARIGDLPAWQPPGGWETLHTPGNGHPTDPDQHPSPAAAEPDVDDDAFWFDPDDDTYRDDNLEE